MTAVPTVSGWTTTQVGLDAAASASSGSLTVSIATLKLATGFGYIPSLATGALQGTVVYTGVPNSWAKLDNGDLEVVFTLPANVGPFQYGEAGIFLDDGTLFAVAAWSTLQLKAEVVANGVANILTFRARLKLGPNPSVFMVTTSQDQAWPAVSTTAQVMGPAAMQGTVNALVVNESVLGGDNIVLTKVTDTRWLCLNFMTVTAQPITLTLGMDNIIESDAFGSNYMNPALPINSWLVQDALGNVRTVGNIVTQTATNGQVMLTSAIVGISANLGTDVILHRHINSLI